jgi:tetratricopeptide (TPR) repeat protein/GGDEF domain-containing protein
VPHFYRSSDEFVAAAQAAVAGAVPKKPVSVLIGEVDPVEEPAGATAVSSGESRLGVVAETVRHMLRGDDHVGLINDRLILVLAGTTAEDGRSVGERICAATRIHSFGQGLGHLTLSIGSAAAPEHGTSFDAVLAAARTALTRVQAQGRDGALAAPPPHHEALHRPLSIDRFAGRAQELSSLIRWLDEACAGQPRIVSVFGDAGLGSTTLLRQLESEVRLRGGLFAMASSPRSDVWPPYGVWSALLRATHRFPAAPEREWQELPHLEPSLGPADDTRPHTGSQYRLLGELTEYFRSIAAERPLVLVLDEMQVADSTSWDALEHMLSQLDTDRILVCLAHRPDSAYDTSPHRQMLSRHEIAREIVLSRLTRDEVKQWLEAAFHRQQVGREFLAFLYRHTEGNPLFIVQLLRDLAEDGAIWHNGTRWEWSPVSELRVPADRSALIGKRLGRFSSSTLAVLGTAAAIGREFDIALLVAAGAGSEMAVRLATSEALSAGLLMHTHERKQGSFAFAHDEIAEVVVDTIPRDRVRQLHQRVAQAFERTRRDRTGEIALHFDAAGEADDAYRTSQVAAKTADRVYAYAAAGHYLQIAARNATSPGELAEIRVALAHIAETRGRFDEVEELCDLAIEWFEGQSDERRALTLRRMRERARIELGQPAKKTLEALIALDAEAKRLGVDGERISILLATSQTYGRLGDSSTAIRIAGQGVEMAERLGDPALLGDALIRLGTASLSEAPGRSYTIYSRALALYESIGDTRGQARSFGNLGIAAQFESRLDEAVQAYTRAIAVARAGGIPDLWGTSALNLGVLSQKCGDYDRAREQIGEALALFAAVKHSEYQLAALFNMAHVERELGLWESASELYEATIPLAQRIGQADIEIGAIAGAGLCALELGRIDAARTAVRELNARVGDRPNWFQGREIVEALFVRTLVIDGRPIEAFARFTSAVAVAESSDLYNAAWLTAVCAEALLEFDQISVKSSITRYTDRVRQLGYAEMTRRFESLARR